MMVMQQPIIISENNREKNLRELNLTNPDILFHMVLRGMIYRCKHGIPKVTKSICLHTKSLILVCLVHGLGTAVKVIHW